jgi:hypothetical protein
MLPSSVTFEYGERSYTFAQDPDKVMKGKLSCDCTKSLLIRQYCDASFPALKCGQKIRIVSLEDSIAPSVRSQNTGHSNRARESSGCRGAMTRL